MRPQVVFALDVPFGRHEKLFQQDSPHGALSIRELDRRTQRHQCRGRRRGMDDRAIAIAEDRVILVLTNECEAVISTLPQAVMFHSSEIPAARPLQ